MTRASLVTSTFSWLASLPIQSLCSQYSSSAFARRSAQFSATVREVDNGPTIYHTGDTDVFTDMRLIPEYFQVDLMLSATGQQPLEDRPAFGAIFRNDARQLGSPSLDVRGRWVREGDFKLIVPGPARPPVPLALYDLSTDPEERHHLANDPRHHATVRRLTRLLDAWWTPGDDGAVPHPPE
jgi:arylsulfatase A